jgi:hypothetical protein
MWDVSQWYSIANTTDTLGSHDIILPSIPIQSSELPSSISISGLSEVNVGETITLSESYPSGGLEGVVWISSNTNLATVDESGVVSGVAEGSVTIYAYSYYSHNVVASQSIECLGARTYDITFEEAQ